MSLPVGTVLWKKPKEMLANGNATNTIPVLPGDDTADHTVFAGVVTRYEENETGVIPLATAGRALVRVLGPVGIREAVYKSVGNNYVVGESGIPVGICVEAVASPTVPGTPTLAKVDLTPYGGIGTNASGVPLVPMQIQTLEVIGGQVIPKHRYFICSEYF